MDHRFLKDRILLYLDGELPAQEDQQCRDHLNGCRQCRQLLETFTSVWQNENEAPVSVASARLKARIDTAIGGQEIPLSIQVPFKERLAYIVRPVLMVATLVIGILVGSYLGQISTTPRIEDAPIASNEIEQELVLPYMESFQDLPPESVGRVYMMVTVDE